MNWFDFIAPFYEFLHPGAFRTAEKMRTLVSFYNTDKVLDLGGGTGRVAKHLANYVGQVFVADSSEAMIQKCQSHAGLTCVLAKAESLPFEDKFFDKVIIVDTFHHFQNREGAVSEIKRVLKPEGKVAIAEFNPRRLSGALVKKMESLFKLGSTFYAPDSLEDFWEARGFEVELHDADKGSYYMIARIKI